MSEEEKQDGTVNITRQSTHNRYASYVPRHDGDLELASTSEVDDSPEGALLSPKSRLAALSTQDKRANLHALFTMFDDDGSGSINSSQLPELLSLLGVQDDAVTTRRLAAQLHADVNGDISRADYDGTFAFYAAQDSVFRQDPKATEGDDKGDEEMMATVYQATQRFPLQSWLSAFTSHDADAKKSLTLDQLAQAVDAVQPGEGAALAQDMQEQLVERVGLRDFARLLASASGETLAGRRVQYAKLWDKAEMPEEVEHPQVADEDTGVMQKLGVRYMEQVRLDETHAGVGELTAAGDDDDDGKDWTKGGSRRSAQLDLDTDPTVHMLTDDNLTQLKTLERWTIFWDVFAGFLSGVLVSCIEIPVSVAYCTDGMEESDSSECDSSSKGDYSFGTRVLYFWLIVGTISVVSTIVEIVFMYIIHLRAAVKASYITGLQTDGQTRQFVIAALSRAALELPHPTSKALGVDPMERASKLRIIAAGIVYKLKRSVTTFLVRIIFKRVLTRIAVKSLGSVLPFIGVPVNMMWNAFIGYKIMRSSRIISLGPAIAIKAFDVMLAQRRGATYQPLSLQASEGLIRSVCVVVVGKREMHPNIQLLLQHICRRLNVVNTFDQPGDQDLFIEHLRAAKPFDRRFMLHVFSFACILDGFLQPQLGKLFVRAATAVQDQQLLLHDEDDMEKGQAGMSRKGSGGSNSQQPRRQISTKPLIRLIHWFIRSELEVEDVLNLFDPTREGRPDDEDSDNCCSCCDRETRTTCTRCCDRCMLCFAC